MGRGQCLCGATRYEFDGPPEAVVACHCLPCRKTSGTTASINVMVKRPNFRLTAGEPRTFTRQGDSGKGVTYTFCAHCPTILFVQAEHFPAINIVKIGTLEDELYDTATIGSEIYTKHRPDWCQNWFPQASQVEGSS